MAAYIFQYGIWLASWWLIGRGAFQGHLDVGWLSAWTLAIMTLVPVRSIATWVAGRAIVDAGALLKQRLLTGALRLDPDGIRERIVGHRTRAAQETRDGWSTSSWHAR